MNKDLVLREYLAIERTRLANEATLLAYIRTGLYFLVAGSTIGQFVDTVFWRYAGGPIIAIGFAIMIAGIIRYRKVKKTIEMTRKNVGNSTNDFIEMVRSNPDW